MRTHKNKGITLVALVVTIIILLILAGISIAALTQTGLFGKTKQAEQKSKDAQELENLTLADYENKIDSTVNGSRDTVTISKEEYEKIKNTNIYSEDEIKIGTWTDGKTIYKKNIVVNVNNSTDYVFDAKKEINENIDVIIRIYGYSVVDGGNVYANFPCYYTNVAYLGSWSKITNKEVHVVSGTQYATATHYLTFEYTKTTD